MQLVTDWKLILKRAWSIRFIVLAGVLSGVEAVLPYFSDAIPRGTFSTLTLVVTSFALIARVTSQKDLPDDQ